MSENQTDLPIEVPYAIRAYVYRLFLAVFALLQVRGFVAEGEVSVWVDIAEAFLGLGALGLAVGHTPRPGKQA